MTLLDQVLQESEISRLPTTDEIAQLSLNAMQELERDQSAIITRLRYRATIHVDCLIHRIMKLQADIERLEAPSPRDFVIITNPSEFPDDNPRLRTFLDTIKPPPRGAVDRQPPLWQKILDRLQGD